MERAEWNIYITICKIDSQREFIVWYRELSVVLCDNPKGGMGWEMGGRWHMCNYGLFMLMDRRNQHSTVKHLSSKEK